MNSLKSFVMVTLLATTSVVSFSQNANAIDLRPFIQQIIPSGGNSQPNDQVPADDQNTQAPEDGQNTQAPEDDQNAQALEDDQNAQVPTDYPSSRRPQISQNIRHRRYPRRTDRFPRHTEQRNRPTRTQHHKGHRDRQ